jgi:competence ComEA-like helix-hairpin-helix protein
MVNSFLNNYFGFNKQQRNGLILLSIISLILFLVRIIYPSFITPDKIEIKNLPLIEQTLDSSYQLSQDRFSGNVTKENTALNLFVFDPNTITNQQLQQLGFNKKSAQTFLKFRDRGFVFKEKIDLKKVYGISDNFYSKLEPYIIIENKNSAANLNSNKSESNVTASANKNQTKVELNTADSLALLDINGIGPAFAKRILKYRSLLGGFVSVEQLKEVYGFTDEMFEKIKPNVTANAELIKKINLNKDDFRTVNKHPYLSYELTKTLFDWRKKTVITAVNLKDIINQDQAYNKLMPYISFN